MLKTKSHEGFEIEIESDSHHHRVSIFLVAGDRQSMVVEVYQRSEEGNFLVPTITWTGQGRQSIAATRKTAQALNLAALIAADIDSWIEK